ncbi:MAG: hypothetical protein H6740_29555 [Alphaproteobacteria bacterium]|nr:hypothetical protein [Alphaproteobacteria bacterium]
MSDLTPLGHARVFRAPDGSLVVDGDSIRRDGFAGDDFAGDDFDDDFEGDFDDFEGDFEDDDFGAGGRGRARREGRREARDDRREDRRSSRGRGRSRGSSRSASSKREWGATAVGGVDTLTDAGSAVVNIRLQHDFKATDVTFEGSSSGAKVTSIFFGDVPVWSSATGLPVSAFGASSQLRGLLEGQKLKAGLDITVNGTLTGAGTFQVTITGEKPVARC